MSIFNIFKSEPPEIIKLITGELVKVHRQRIINYITDIHQAILKCHELSQVQKAVCGSSTGIKVDIIWVQHWYENDCYFTNPKLCFTCNGQTFEYTASQLTPVAPALSSILSKLDDYISKHIKEFEALTERSNIDEFANFIIHNNGFNTQI